MVEQETANESVVFGTEQLPLEKRMKLVEAELNRLSNMGVLPDEKVDDSVFRRFGLTSEDDLDAFIKRQQEKRAELEEAQASLREQKHQLELESQNPLGRLADSTREFISKQRQNRF